MAKGLKSVPTLSAKEIAQKHGLSLEYIIKQIAKGVKVEKEHTKSTKEANEIARDHLGERPDYYIKLDKMEKSKVSLNELGEYDNKGGSPVVGDLTGSSRKVAKVDEDIANIKKKLGKAAKVGSVVGALGAHAGKVYDVGNVVSHHDDPGLATATAVSYLHPASRMLQAAPTVLKVDKAGKGENEFKRQKLYGGKKLHMAKEDKDPCWKGYEMVGMKKKGNRKVPNCVPVEESEMEEGYASIGHAYDWAGDVNRRAKFYGNKPKPTTTKNDEKDDTYKDSNKNKKVKFAKTVKEEQIDELKAETLGSYIKKASASRKDALEKGGAKADIKTWGKRQKGITTAIKKLTNEELMDTKDQIQEAIGNIMEENLHEMKENLLNVLQEKAMLKLEERKKEIAANYFAQD